MDDFLAFIELKCDLFAKAWDHPGARANWDSHFVSRVDAYKLAGRLSKAEAKRFEVAMEKFASFSDPEIIASARKKLRERFGFDRIGISAEVVLQRVLKRGKIRNDNEAELVRDTVANQASERLLGSESYRRLAAILDEAGY